LGYTQFMSDDLYERDALAWSVRQAALLRRVARGERVNDVDWDHVVEEIEDVGLSELHAVRSYLEQILVHLLKLHGWPDISADQHWRAEIVAFQSDAERRFAPSMRQRIDLEKLYGRAVRQIELTRYDGKSGVTPPAGCPVTLDLLLSASVAELEAAISQEAN
jgi:predicted nucleotidyltransferase